MNNVLVRIETTEKDEVVRILRNLAADIDRLDSIDGQTFIQVHDSKGNEAGRLAVA